MRKLMPEVLVTSIVSKLPVVSNASLPKEREWKILGICIGLSGLGKLLSGLENLPWNIAELYTAPRVFDPLCMYP